MNVIVMNKYTDKEKARLFDNGVSLDTLEKALTTYFSNIKSFNHNPLKFVLTNKAIEFVFEVRNEKGNIILYPTDVRLYVGGKK